MIPVFGSLFFLWNWFPPSPFPQRLVFVTPFVFRYCWLLPSHVLYITLSFPPLLFSSLRHILFSSLYHILLTQHPLIIFHHPSITSSRHPLIISLSRSFLIPLANITFSDHPTIHLSFSLLPPWPPYYFELLHKNMNLIMQDKAQCDASTCVRIKAWRYGSTV